ncbi:hypothetical protein B9Z55_011735 [Caenorhabditis nigoni]|uniref:Uncharacterized protein n=1 Tax=Caenorhabditis nigoni TaxID=1611254 RepID=A0A2G5ULG4_9PELO|nr:hypothetical protein B9Z55_011735 [Caenorhabditis nigoni]
MSVSSNLIENQINKGILKLKEDHNLKLEKDPELIDLVTKELLMNSGGVRQKSQDLSMNLPKFYATDQTWLELQMRIGNAENPQNPLIPQTSVYLPGIYNGVLAPKHPFGLPSYHYYTCPSIRGTIPRKSTYDYVLPPKYHGHQPKVQISNSKVTLEPFGAFPAMEIWSFGENIIYSTPDQHCSAYFNSSKLVLSNGVLIDELAGKEVKIVMNNQFELKEKIRKIAFSVKTNFVEVLMLLENYTMASGCIFENMRKRKLNVSIFEMPGTYGTTDFQCSPDFKSMVRVSQMKRNIPKMSKIEEKIEYNSKSIRHILKRVMQHYEAQNWNQMHSMEWFKLACQFCQCTVTAGKRLSNPDAEIQIPDHLTPMEKIVNLSTVETKECGLKEPCLNAWDLIAIGRRIAEGKFEVFWGDDKKELLAEYSHQVLIALYGLADLFGNHRTMSGKDKRSKIASLNLYQFYNMSVKHLLSCFEISALAVRVIILDIACLKATPSQYAQILDLYPVAPKLVARVVRKYPYLVLFGNSPIFPPIRLIRLAGHILNETTSEFEKSKKIKEIELVDLTMDSEDVEIPEDVAEDEDVIFIKNVKSSEVVRRAPEDVTEAMEPEVVVEASGGASEDVTDQEVVVEASAGASEDVMEAMEQDDSVEASEDVTDSEVIHIEGVKAPEVVEHEKIVENPEEAASEDVTEAMEQREITQDSVVASEDVMDQEVVVEASAGASEDVMEAMEQDDSVEASEDVTDSEVIHIEGVKAPEVVEHEKIVENPEEAASEDVTEAMEQREITQDSVVASEDVMEPEVAVEASEVIQHDAVSAAEEAPEDVMEREDVTTPESPEDVPSSSSRLLAILEERNLKYPDWEKSNSDPNFIILNDEDVRRIREFQNSRILESQSVLEDVEAQKSDSEGPEEVRKAPEDVEVPEATPEDVIMVESLESTTSKDPEFTFSHPEDVSTLSEAPEDVQQEIRDSDDSPILEFSFARPEDVTSESRPDVLSPDAPEAARSPKSCEDVTRKLDASEESPLREFAFARPEDVSSEFEASEAAPEDVVVEDVKIPEDVIPKFSFAHPEELPESPTRGFRPLPPRFSVKYKFAKPRELEDVEILEFVEVLEASEEPEDVRSESKDSEESTAPEVTPEVEDVIVESTSSEDVTPTMKNHESSEDVTSESPGEATGAPEVNDSEDVVVESPESKHPEDVAPEAPETESPTTSNGRDSEDVRPESPEVVILEESPEESPEDYEAPEYPPEFDYAVEYMDSEDVIPESSESQDLQESENPEDVTPESSNAPEVSFSPETKDSDVFGNSEDVTGDAQESIESDGDQELKHSEDVAPEDVTSSEASKSSESQKSESSEDVMPESSESQDSQKPENPEDVTPEAASKVATSSRKARKSKNPKEKDSEDVTPEGSSKSPIPFSFKKENPSTSRTTPDSEATRMPLVSPGGRKPYTQVIAELVGDDDFEIPPGVSPYRNTLEGQKRMKRVADEPTTSSSRPPPKKSRKKILEDVTTTPKRRHALYSKSTIPKFRGDYEITTEFTKEANKKKREESGSVADRTRTKKASTQERIQKVMKIGQKKRGK